MMKLVRSAYFSAGHTFDVNEGFGHNFRVDARIKGEPDPTTQMIVNLRDVDRWLKAVLEKLDHHYLNDDVAYFKTHRPTLENIAVYIFEELSKLVVGARLDSVRVYETRDRWVDYSDQELPAD